MRLVQFLNRDGQRSVGVPSEDGLYLWVVSDATYVQELALTAYRQGVRLTELLAARLSHERADYAAVIAEKRLLPPLDHPDPAHFIVSGTGLDHLGSALARNAMHTQAVVEQSETDSMKMFRLGLAGGKPDYGKIGVAPEWFYKGDGSIVVASEQALELPPYALDGGEEAEIVGLYVIGDGGEVLRLGLALGNEYSDHMLERQNYLYLAHSKLRQCSIGPELLLGEAPAAISGRVRVLRNGQPLWDEAFLTGEQHMTHWLYNLEHHHFKYPLFRRPGDVHAHFFGASALSVSASVTPQPGDLFEIESPLFGRPLRNPMVKPQTVERLVKVHVL